MDDPPSSYRLALAEHRDKKRLKAWRITLAAFGGIWCLLGLLNVGRELGLALGFLALGAPNLAFARFGFDRPLGLGTALAGLLTVLDVFVLVVVVVFFSFLAILSTGNWNNWAVH